MRRIHALEQSTADARRGASTPAQRTPTLRVVFRGDHVVTEPARALTIGRLAAGRTVGASGLELTDDPLVSREHAIFERTPTGLKVEDQRSRNGVHVNGRSVDSTDLADGDIVRLGGSLVVVRYEDARAIDVPDPELRGVSPAIRLLRVAARRVGPHGAAVLVEGQTGSGKEVVARSIHRTSNRRGAFVAVNCAAIADNLAESMFFGHLAGAFSGAVGASDGFFRAAEGGTLFLDEVGEMSAALQPKLLRALEARAVIPVGATREVTCDVRIVAATNVDLDQAVAAGRFRSDLAARLAQLRVRVPPLSERREDILDLLQHHMRSGGRSDAALRSMDPALAERLVLHDYPRNVRELIAFAARLEVWGEDAERDGAEIFAELFPSAQADAASAATRAASVPRKVSEAKLRALPGTQPDWLRLIEEHGHNLAAVARTIGRSRTQLYRLLDQAGVDREALRR